jgi:hypothetical protein
MGQSSLNDIMRVALLSATLEKFNHLPAIADWTHSGKQAKRTSTEPYGARDHHDVIVPSSSSDDSDTPD